MQPIGIVIAVTTLIVIPGDLSKLILSKAQMSVFRAIPIIQIITPLIWHPTVICPQIVYGIHTLAPRISAVHGSGMLSELQSTTKEQVESSV